jgi:hypothetical protein
MPNPDPNIQASIQGGEERADALIQGSQVSFGPSAGYLIAEGDSWFDYPMLHDIVEALEDDHNYKVRTAAHFGDTAESIAYEDNQLDKLRKVFAELKEDNKTPKAVLLSCGGNDVAHIFDILLNHKKSGLPALNDAIVDALLKVRLKAAITSLISSVITFSKHYFGTALPILIHGYGHPVPDGRGFPVLGLAGPWLKPGFVAKGYVSTDPQTVAELQQNANLVKNVLKRFNDVLIEIAAIPEFAGIVKYVDLRDIFSDVLAANAYQQDWRDEMHATPPAFKRAATRIASNIP